MPAEPNLDLSAHITAQTPLIPAINAWKYYLEDQGRSPHTVKAFAADVMLFASFLPTDHTLGKVTTQDITHFLQWLQENRGVPCSPKSLARRITSIKSFFRWLSRSGGIIADPAEKVLQQSVISPLPVTLTPEEIDAVHLVVVKYRAARKPDARPFILLELLLTTGIKKGECLGISPNHLELDSPEGPFLFVRYSGAHNRYKERKIPLSQEWVEAYPEYQVQYQPGDRVFFWSPRRLEYLLEDIGKEAGLNKHLSFDMCRWTCAVTDWQNGMDTETIRQKLGISKIQWREVSMKLRQLVNAQTQTAEAPSEAE